jgi:hypothetical protein
MCSLRILLGFCRAGTELTGGGPKAPGRHGGKRENTEGNGGKRANTGGKRANTGGKRANAEGNGKQQKERELPNGEKLVSLKEKNGVSTEDPSKKDYTITANLLSPRGKTSSARVVRTGVRDSTPSKYSDPEGFRRHTKSRTMLCEAFATN